MVLLCATFTNAAISSGGVLGDEQTSILYDAFTGAIGVDAPASTQLTAINIDSAGSIFTGGPALNLGGSFDSFNQSNIFKATFGGSFGSITFGNVATTGLSEAFILSDFSVVGSLAGGGDLGPVDLYYIGPSTPGTPGTPTVPVPGAFLLAGLGSGFVGWMRRRKSI
jgi:hypothetical protein